MTKTIKPKEKSTVAPKPAKRRRRKPRRKPATLLTDWDWTTLVASWRYYEHRATIASATFPAALVARYFSRRAPYTDVDRKRIATQFALVDHGLLKDHEWDGASECDRRPWCKLYSFLEAYAHDDFLFYKGHRIFWCWATGRFYPVDEYVASPQSEIYIDTAKNEDVRAMNATATETSAAPADAKKPVQAS